MSEVKRYSLRYDQNFEDSYMEEYKDGDYTLSDDYDTLEAELTQLRTERDALRDAIKLLADKVEHEASFDDVLRKRISGSIAAARAVLQEER